MEVHIESRSVKQGISKGTWVLGRTGEGAEPNQQIHFQSRMSAVALLDFVLLVK
jgi:hypothetical protein